MATHLGKDGVIKEGTTNIAETRSWNLETNADTAETTVIGDDWKKFKSTIKSWHGSLSCFFDSSDTGQSALVLGATVTLNLYPEGSAANSKYFSGDAIITSINHQVAHNNIVEASLNFQGSGAFTQLTVP